MTTLADLPLFDAPDPKPPKPCRRHEWLGRQWDEADNMCPNCITPWKCNGPHLSDQTIADHA